MTHYTYRITWTDQLERRCEVKVHRKAEDRESDLLEASSIATELMLATSDGIPNHSVDIDELTAEQYDELVRVPETEHQEYEEE